MYQIIMNNESLFDPFIFEAAKSKVDSFWENKNLLKLMVWKLFDIKVDDSKKDNRKVFVSKINSAIKKKL